MSEREAGVRMDVLVIEPGHGSVWLDDAVFVDRFRQPNPRGRFVTGTTWVHEGGWNIPEGGFDYPETLTYPRRFVLKIVARAAALQEGVS